MSNTVAVPKDFLLRSLELGVILPSQFCEYMKGQPALQPEKRLMLAVMEDALKTFHSCLPGVTRRQRRLLKEVEEWFASAEAVWLFSFENVCAVLNLDVDYLRRGLARWKARQRAQQSDVTSTSLSSFRRGSGRRHTLSARQSSCSRQRRRGAA